MQKTQLKNKWIQIYSLFDIEVTLNGKRVHIDCPLCYEKKKFRLINAENGVCICAKCNSKGMCPFNLIQELTGLSFKDICLTIEDNLNLMKENVEPDLNEATKNRFRQIWSEAKFIEKGDLAYQYFESRGLKTPKTKDMKIHPDLYYKEGDFTCRCPCIVSLIRNEEVCGCQLYYLGDVPVKRKTRKWKDYSGGYIKLFEAPEKGILCVGEGIETVLSYTQQFKLPGWALIDAGNLEKFKGLGPNVALVIAGDNDASGRGQKAAYTLMHKLRTLKPKERVPVKVDIPPGEGDWNDHLFEMKRKWDYDEQELLYVD